MGAYGKLSCTVRPGGPSVRTVPDGFRGCPISRTWCGLSVAIPRPGTLILSTCDRTLQVGPCHALPATEAAMEAEAFDRPAPALGHGAPHLIGRSNWLHPERRWPLRGSGPPSPLWTPADPGWVPELPEVDTVHRGLAPTVLGKRVESAISSGPDSDPVQNR